VVCRRADWLFSDRRHPGGPVFPGLAMIGAAGSEIGRESLLRRERHHLPGPGRLEAGTFARAVRAHRGIESRLHCFRDDPAHPRSGHGPETMAVVRRMALNLLRRAEPAPDLKNSRRLAGWSLDHLSNLPRGTASAFHPIALACGVVLVRMSEDEQRRLRL
jgi:hypothetical protein